MDTKTQVTDFLINEYHVQSRVNKGPEPTALQPTKAESPEGSVNENIAVVVERVLNKDSSMLKKGTVQPVGTDKFSGINS
ncbi:hypothetical protein [uncultured Cocleimonas sp.]|uniref:hypothetical protein n=1 Tax=uncultured Cocleimonas sp. TaxID=1051587 RepID=UPI0026162B1D|nr:hypothetical protein [uncultured Cocleimonas sp.]